MKVDELGISIGEKVKKLREKKGVSLRKVGEACGVDYSYIAKVEKGRKPSIKLLEKIADYFGVDVKYFMGLTEEEEDFLNDMNSLNPEEFMLKHKLTVDGKPVSKEEAKAMIETLRFLRSRF